MLPKTTESACRPCTLMALFLDAGENLANCACTPCNVQPACSCRQVPQMRGQCHSDTPHCTELSEVTLRCKSNSRKASSTASTSSERDGTPSVEAPVVKKRIEFHHVVSSSVLAESIKDQVVAHANTPQRANLKSNSPRNPWCEEIIRSGGYVNLVRSCQPHLLNTQKNLIQWLQVAACAFNSCSDA